MGQTGINYSQVQNEYKEIHSGMDNLEQLFKGIQTLSNVVAGTMGVKGKTVIIHDGTKDTTIATKDGVTVAKSIFLKDPVENIGANQVKQVAENVVKAAGDGTTTATVLTAALVGECIKLLKEGKEAYDIVRSLDDLKHFLVSHLEDSILNIESQSDVHSIAHIASNSDEEITTLIVNAVMNFSEDTVINIAHSSTSGSFVEETKGYSIDRGFLDHNFKDQNKVSVEYSNPLIFVTKEELVGTYDVEHLMQIAREENRPLVIIAKDFLQDAYNYIAMNKLHRSFPILPIKAPRHGIEQHNILEDIATYTNATLVSKDSGFAMGMVELDDFGTCDSIKAGSDYTHIFGGHHNGVLVEERVAGLKIQLQDTIERDKHEHFVQSIKERISKLEGGIATIYVGGFTTQEIEEKYDRVEDSLLATISAIDHGYIVGGGLFYLRLSLWVKNAIPEGTDGHILASLSRALAEPAIIILKNAMIWHKDETQAMVNALHYNVGGVSLKELATFNTWINSANGSITDMNATGIIDAAKSTEAIINNSIAFAKTFITTHATIVHKLEYFQNIQ